MDDENDILILYYITKAISFNGGMYGTTTVLLDASVLFGKRALNKINFKIKAVAREIHEVCCPEDFLQVTKSSSVSDPENIHQDKLRKYFKNGLFFSVVSIFKSVNSLLWLN